MDADRKPVLVEQYVVEAAFACPMYVIPAGAWHSSEALVSGTIIFESKDGRYGEDGSEAWADPILSPLKGDDKIPEDNGFSNSLGDLKEQITYLIGMERHSGSMEVITPLYVSRMLNVPLEEVEKCIKEMGV